MTQETTKTLPLTRSYIPQAIFANYMNCLNKDETIISISGARDFDLVNANITARDIKNGLNAAWVCGVQDAVDRIFELTQQGLLSPQQAGQIEKALQYNQFTEV